MKKIEEKINTPEDVEELLKQPLGKVKNTSGIELVAIVARNGILIFPLEEKLESFVAMSATALGSIEQILTELNKGFLYRIVVEANTCNLIITGAGPKAVLVVMARTDASLSKILFRIDDAAEEIKKILG